MDGLVARRNDSSPPPPPTWGSAMNVSSGSASMTSSHQVATPPQRILELHLSPELPSSRRTNRRTSQSNADMSSPVEEFSSPAKHPQASELDSYYSSGPTASGSRDRSGSGEGNIAENLIGPSNVRVGAWEVPDIQEREPAQVDIDPNGDDEEVAEQVARFVANERELERKRMELEMKRKRIERDEAPPSSMPSQMSAAEVNLTPSRIPQASTPPPAKRQRRGQVEAEPASSSQRSIAPIVPVITPIERRTENQSIAHDLNPSELASIFDILDRPFEEASRYALTRYSQASPLIPDFLKGEIQRCIAKADQQAQSQSSKSDSDTQEDGYLKTKPVWVFELLRRSSKGIFAGNELTSAVQDDEWTLVLHIFSDGMTYGVQLIDRPPLMMSRNELRSNPWFDCHGHLFSIIYQKQVMVNGSESSSLITQASAEQLSLLQSENEQLQEEKRIALYAKEEAEKKLQSALTSNQLTQETNDFLKEQYSVASSMAAEATKQVQTLTDEVTSLQLKLTEGMKTVRAFSQQRVETLQAKLKVTESQLHLLKQQNRLTNDAVREKAAKWETYQAKEEVRIKEVERRRAEVNADTIALYQSMQEEDARRILNERRPPHEHFLEVDLAEEKMVLPSAEVIEDVVDELAMLRAEADEAVAKGGQEEVDMNAPRASRRRAAAAPTYVVDPNLADVISHSQQQAQAEVNEALQSELNYHSLSEL